MQNQYLRHFWARHFRYDWPFGLAMILLFGAVRFIIVLQANVTGNFGAVSLFFLSLWFLPFLFLNKSGRKKMGLKRPERYYWLVFSLLLGLGACTLMHITGYLAYGDSVQNWFVYIGRSFSSFNVDALGAAEKLVVFFISAFVSMTFSPIGEELFYRGFVHEAFVEKTGERKASFIDSAAFSLTHLAHFGIVYVAGHWQFLPIPALLWVAFLFGLCLVFHYCRKMTGSILGAVVCHAGYNFGMMFFIFY